MTVVALIRPSQTVQVIGFVTRARRVLNVFWGLFQSQGSLSRLIIDCDFHSLDEIETCPVLMFVYLLEVEVIDRLP